MKQYRITILAAIMIFIVGWTAVASCEEPSWSLKASPRLGLAPLTTRLTLRIENPGPELYCPAITWTWTDGTKSYREGDCDPWEELDVQTQKDSVIESKVVRLGPGEHTIKVLVKQGKKEVRLEERIEVMGGE